MRLSRARAGWTGCALLSLALAGCATIDSDSQSKSATGSQPAFGTLTPFDGENPDKNEAQVAELLQPVPNPNDDLWIRLRNGYALAPQHGKPAVRDWTHFYLTHRDHLDASLARARPFLWHVVEEVHARGMPMEIALLPIVESGYNPSAHSYAGASGLWQFMPLTAQDMGLTRGWWYDGRLDVLASTDAALDYLTWLHDYFDGDWLLALAAYNAGPGRVGDAIDHARSSGAPTDYWHLDLPQETAEYVPKLFALRRLLGSPERFGIDWPSLNNEPRTVSVELPAQIEMAVAADMLDMPEADLRRLNPGMQRWATAPDGRFELLLPADRANAFSQALANADPDTLVTRLSHTVRSGEALSTIAQAYGLSVAAIRQTNGLRGDRIIAGQRLQLPRPSGPNSRPAPAEPMQPYVVQPGDSLWQIARRYESTVSAVRAANNLSGNNIKPGQTLQLPASATPQPTSYVVRSGDSLWSIAQANNVRVADLRRWNRMAGDATLRPGGTLAVDGPAPLPDYYQVQPGDSLWSIADRFQLQVATLRSLNDMASQSTIQPGQRLRLQPTSAG